MCISNYLIAATLPEGGKLNRRGGGFSVLVSVYTPHLTKSRIKSEIYEHYPWYGRALEVALGVVGSVSSSGARDIRTTYKGPACLRRASANTI